MSSGVRRAETQTIRVFNLLSGRMGATVPDGIMERWVVVVGMGSVCVCVFFCLFVLAMGCYHLDPAIANYKDMKGTNRLTYEEKHRHTHIQNTQNHKQIGKINPRLSQSMSTWTQHAD